MSVISLSLNAAQIKKLEAAIGARYKVQPGPYMSASYRTEDAVINIYTSGKVVFQGKNPQRYAGLVQSSADGTYPQCGSDEVGTGDYFGPVCVCATIVTGENAETLRRSGVGDSKKITDETILKLAPQLTALLPYSLCILSPQKYNEVHNENNMNRIKSMLHNMVYRNLIRKYGSLPELKVIDQFTPEDLYYRYLKGEPEIIRGITFKTKAEDQYLCVGAASIIARYAFLKEMDQMSAQYGVTFPKGASDAVDSFGRKLVREKGSEILAKTAKLNFANTAKILGSRKGETNETLF